MSGTARGFKSLFGGKAPATEDQGAPTEATDAKEGRDFKKLFGSMASKGAPSGSATSKTTSGLGTLFGRKEAGDEGESVWKGMLGNISEKVNTAVKESQKKIQEIARRKEKPTVWHVNSETFQILEPEIKRRVLLLSKDKKTFTTPPPEYTDFVFEYDRFVPLAEGTLEADPQLVAMRYELVPRKMQEEVFWKNYCYRVHLIKKTLLVDFKTQNESLRQDAAPPTASAAAAPPAQAPAAEAPASAVETGVEDGGSEPVGDDIMEQFDATLEMLSHELQVEVGGDADGSPAAGGGGNLMDKAVDKDAVAAAVDDWEKELQAQLGDIDLNALGDGVTPSTAAQEFGDDWEEELKKELGI